MIAVLTKYRSIEDCDYDCSHHKNVLFLRTATMIAVPTNALFIRNATMTKNVMFLSLYRNATMIAVLFIMVALLFIRIVIMIAIFTKMSYI